MPSIGWLVAMLLTSAGQADEQEAPQTTPSDLSGMGSTSLNMSNIGDFGIGKVPAFVMFRYNWCELCNTMYPRFDAAAAAIKTQADAARRGAVVFGDLECTQEVSLCEYYGIKKYPAILLFEPDGETRDCKAQNTQAGFFELFQRFTRPAVRSLGDQESLEQALTNETLVSFVGMAPLGEAMPIGFASAAKRWQHQHSVFAVQEFPAELRAAAGHARVVAYSPPSQQWAADNQTAAPGVAVPKEEINSNETLLEWASQNRFPGVWRLSDANIFDFLYQGKRSVLVGVDPRKSNRDVESSLRAAAQAFPDDFSFGVADAIEWREFFEELNVYRSELPAAVVVENDFLEWVRDSDLMRLSHLAKDLRAFLDGAPVLRDGKTWTVKLVFHKEKTKRIFFGMLEGVYKMPFEGRLAGVALALLTFAYWAYERRKEKRERQEKQEEFDAWQKDYLARQKLKEEKKEKEKKEKGVSAPESKSVRQRRRPAENPSTDQQD